MKMTSKRMQPAFPPPIYVQSANQIVSAATTLKETVNPFDEFPDVFPETKNLDLPLLRPGMDHRSQLKDPDLKISPRNLKLKHKFLLQLFEKLRQEQKSGRVYKPTPPDQSCSAIFMTLKIDKPDKARFLHDLVARNDNTYYNPPNIPDQYNIINAVANTKFRSKIDLTDRYHNLRIIPEYEKHTAFKTPFGVYRTRVMQQGDKNAPSTFQNAMNTLFQDELGVFVYIYIDDIFIFSKTYKEHVNHIRHVLKKLRDNQFYADRKKSQFLPGELSILRHAITRRGIRPGPGRVRKILDWPTPSNIKKFQTFLGMVNYCSQFASQLATISSPLIAMAGSTANWDWTYIHWKSFELIKPTLSADPAVRPLDYKSADPIFFVTNASLIDTGEWVSQGSSVLETRPAAFHSRKFNSVQVNYSTFDKELLAIVDALEHFRPVLSGCRFTILTDHKPLVAFPKQTELLGRQAR